MKGRNTTIALLITTTMSLVGATGINCYLDSKETTLVNQIKMETVIEEKDMKVEQQLINQSLKSMNKMIVSKGCIETSYRFSNKDWYIMYDYDGIYNMMKCLWNKLTYNDVTFTAQYNYNITYNLANIKTELEYDCIKIKIYEAQFNVEDFQIDFETAKVGENNGILAKDFTSNQTAAMISYAKDHTANYVRTKQEFIENATLSLENNIKDLCKKLGIENYQIEVYENNTLTNQNEYMDVKKYSQETIKFHKEDLDE